MNEKLELLEYIYKSSEMGIQALTNILKEIKDKENKLKGLISDELTLYENYYKISKELLKKNKAKFKGINIIVKTMSKEAIKTEIKRDNSDAAIAHMLIEGFTMGVVDIESKIKNFDKKVDKDILDFANKYLKFQQDEIEKLKKYL